MLCCWEHQTSSCLEKKLSIWICNDIYCQDGWVTLHSCVRGTYLISVVLQQTGPVERHSIWNGTYIIERKEKRGYLFGISCPIHLLIPDSGISSEQHAWSTAQFGSVAQSCPTLCDSMDCSTPGLPVHHQLPEFNLTHVHWVGDAIQPSHPLLPTSPPAFNLSHYQGLFKWVRAFHQVAKVMAFQLQHQSLQWTFRTDFL